MKKWLPCSNEQNTSARDEKAVPEYTQGRDLSKRGQKRKASVLKALLDPRGKSVLVFAIFLRDRAVPTIFLQDGPTSIIVISNLLKKLSSSTDSCPNHLILKVIMPDEIVLLWLPEIHKVNCSIFFFTSFQVDHRLFICHPDDLYFYGAVLPRLIWVVQKETQELLKRF